MVVKSAAAQKEHFLSCAVSSYFLVLFVEFFLENSQKQVFLHNVMNLILLPALLFFGWENFAMMIPKKDSRQLVRPCRTQKNNKEGFTFILSMRTAVSPWSAPLKSGGGSAPPWPAALRGGFPVQHKR